MDKTLMIAKWFYENNNIVRTDSYNGNVLLNKLCFYSKAMFLSLNHNIIKKDAVVLENKIIFPFIYNKYKDNDLLNCKIELLNDELKVLKIINRTYGILKNDDYEQISFKQFNSKIEDNKINDVYKDEMLELYDYYKDEELNEKLEIINDKYFLITPDVKLTNDEYNELFNIKYDDNITYYVSRDDEGNLVVY